MWLGCGRCSTVAAFPCSRLSKYCKWWGCGVWRKHESRGSWELERQPEGRKTPSLVGDLGPGRPRTFDPGPRILDPDIGLRASRYEADAQSPGTCASITASRSYLRRMEAQSSNFLIQHRGLWGDRIMVRKWGNQDISTTGPPITSKVLSLDSWAQSTYGSGLNLCLAWDAAWRVHGHLLLCK